MIKRFNIRVYGLLIKDGAILVNEELIKGRNIIKFPGGGLDWGEGIADCLKREWMEELGLEINIVQHFYTTDFFQQSAFDDSQIISIYYLVDADLPKHLVNHVANEKTYWLPLSEVHEATFTLPIDRVVGKLLMANRHTNKPIE
jgi:ADP-ribose pyrophosphatase YjhB (NUDIX family)